MRTAVDATAAAATAEYFYMFSIEPAIKQLRVPCYFFQSSSSSTFQLLSRRKGRPRRLRCTFKKRRLTRLPSIPLHPFSESKKRQKCKNTQKKPIKFPRVPTKKDLFRPPFYLHFWMPDKLDEILLARLDEVETFTFFRYWTCGFSSLVISAVSKLTASSHEREVHCH